MPESFFYIYYLSIKVSLHLLVLHTLTLKYIVGKEFLTQVFPSIMKGGIYIYIYINVEVKSTLA